MFSESRTTTLLLGICLALGSSAAISDVAFGADPVIHVTWDDPGTPMEDTHYRIIDTDPDYPNVELIEGSLTWRIWSTDTDNEDDIGDIGTISCPHADNFAVTILDDSGGVGARDVKAITLVPSSSSNYANLVGDTSTGSRLSGEVLDALTVTASSSGTGARDFIVH